MLDVIEAILKQYDCEYMEIRVEDTQSTSVRISSVEIEEAGEYTSLGGCVRVLYNGGWGFVSFNNVAMLKEYVEEAFEVAKSVKGGTGRVSKEHGGYKGKYYTPYLKDPSDIGLETKVELAVKYNEILKKGENIVSCSVRYGDFKKKKYYVNNLGTSITQTVIGTGVFFSAMGKDGDNVQQAYHSEGEMTGFELVEDLEHIAERVVNDVNILLKAPKVVGGRKTVILDPKLTGVFTHEAFGHLSEADFLYQNEDMKKKMEPGTKFGSDFLNIVDDGTIRGARGFYHFDDEGVPSKKNYLIQNGKLTGRLHSRETAAYLGEPVSGNARAISYRYAPIVRMSATYIEPQETSFEEMISDIKDGIYACGMLGGNTDLEMFTFSSEKAYEIKNGKLGKVVRDVVLSGNVFETMHNIEAIGDDFKMYGGMGGCGKEGQSPLPVSDGGPHIRIKDVLIG